MKHVHIYYSLECLVQPSIICLVHIIAPKSKALLFLKPKVRTIGNLGTQISKILSISSLLPYSHCVPTQAPEAVCAGRNGTSTGQNRGSRCACLQQASWYLNSADCSARCVILCSILLENTGTGLLTKQWPSGWPVQLRFNAKDWVPQTIEHHFLTAPG